MSFLSVQSSVFQRSVKDLFLQFSFDNLHFREALWKAGGLDGRDRPRIVSVAEHAREAELLGRGRGDVEAEFAQSREEQRLLKTAKATRWNAIRIRSLILISEVRKCRFSPSRLYVHSSKSVALTMSVF